jgi:hypothetical protein
MRTAIVLALALVLSSLYFGYRITRLEQRLEALDTQLGAPEIAAAPAAGAQANKPAPAYAQRLAALEQDVHALRDDLRTLEQAVNGPVAAPTPGDEQQILSIMGREQSRVRDRQLDFHRSRWVKWREAAIESFAARNNVSPAQADQLRRLLTDEVDQMVDILRRPDAADDPEKASADWMRMLERTDDAAHRVLDPAQRAPWDLERAVERRALWPWLPERDSGKPRAQVSPPRSE